MSNENKGSGSGKVKVIVAPVPGTFKCGTPAGTTTEKEDQSSPQPQTHVPDYQSVTLRPPQNVRVHYENGVPVIDWNDAREAAFYIVELKEKGGTDSVVHPEIKSVHVCKDLKPNIPYVATIRAQNKFATSDPSREIEVIFKSDDKNASTNTPSSAPTPEAKIPPKLTEEEKTSGTKAEGEEILPDAERKSGWHPLLWIFGCLLILLIAVIAITLLTSKDDAQEANEVVPLSETIEDGVPVLEDTTNSPKIMAKQNAGPIAITDSPYPGTVIHQYFGSTGSSPNVNTPMVAQDGTLQLEIEDEANIISITDEPLYVEIPPGFTVNIYLRPGRAVVFNTKTPGIIGYHNPIPKDREDIDDVVVTDCITIKSVSDSRTIRVPLRFTKSLY